MPCVFKQVSFLLLLKIANYKQTELIHLTHTRYMKKISYRLVYNRKKQLNRQGKALIQIEAYLNKQKIYFSTHIYVHPEQWDDRRKQIIAHPQDEELNRMIDESVLRLQWKELEYWKQGKVVSLNLLKPQETESEPVSPELIVFGRKVIAQSWRKESTKRNLNTTLDILQIFRPSLRCNELTYSFLLDFENHLRQCKYSVNTIAKHMKQLRTLTNEVIRQGYLSHNDYPFRNYRIKTETKTHKFLLPSELQLLENLTVADKYPELKHVLDAFLFCCYTGLRYSDFTALSTENFITLNKKQWLVFHSQKTGVRITIPLYLLFQGKAIDILNKYKPQEDKLFRLNGNSTVNKNLERLRLLAKLHKHISFHTARHTHASLLLYQGVRITTIQKLLGHRSVKTTEIYSEVFPETIIKELEKLNL